MTMLSKGNAPVSTRRAFSVVLSWLAVGIGIAFFAAPAHAQQTGELSGTITNAGGAGVAGVSVRASGDVLPQPRTATSVSNGRYRFRLLPPGNYELEFTFADGSQKTRSATVMLQQTSKVNISESSGSMDEIVVMGTALVADTGQGSLKDSISAATVDALPVGQDYRDLMKIIPGVQYSEDAVRGPSSGSSGADNIYQFDGVDVSLPLFGNLASEPSTHDIAQVSIVRGGAKAIGFNRAGGFWMNTVSKSGTNKFHGEASYQVQSSGMTGDLDNGNSPASFDEDRTWSVISLGGPIMRDRLFFYGSYYRPDHSRSNGVNAYGQVPDFSNVRDEYFGKLTFSPTENILINGSFRSSEREVTNSGVGAFTQASAADVSIANQDLAILEASWIISDASSLNFKYTDFENETGSDPVTFLNVATAIGNSLNIGALEQEGRFNVPTLISNPATPEEIAFNAFAAPLIAQYGFDADGGGTVGAGNQINSQDFFRESFEISYDHIVYAGDMTHDFHIGYKYEEIEEVLLRLSNGWGSISAIGGLETSGGVPVYFRSFTRQQGLTAATGALAPPIVSTAELSSFEINDTIEVGDWVFNIGVLVSNDALFGQGLRPNASNPSGFELAIGNRYKMIETDWSDMIQPRVGATWNFSDTASVYVNYAKYHPPASSLSRAASWDRRFADRLLDVNFDINGNYISSEAANGSGGKLFEAGIKPRSMEEYLVGMTKDFSGDLTVRAHIRHKKGGHFWEDVPNDIYLNGNPPPGIARVEIIPGLEAQLDGVIGDGSDGLGGGSIRSFVIDELDGAYTKYWEAGLEAEWTTDKLYVNASYTWMHYYGNFDNDNTSSFGSDFNSFIGSSSYGDGAGRMFWNFRDGNLRGDRRHLLKVNGYYQFDWNASAGAVFLYQSGEPWTKWQDTPWADEIAAYRAATGRSTSTSDFLRFAEPAGSRRSPTHWQLDFNYTQNFTSFGDHNLQLRADIYNVFNKQTGYRYQPRVDRAKFGEPRRFFKPRRFQVAVKYQF